MAEGLHTMRARWRAVTVLAAFGLIATAVGCGARGDGELTKEEWIAQADGICAALAEELRALPEPRTPEEARESGRQVVRIASRRLAELRELTPPAADATTVARMLDTFEEVITLSGELTEAIAAEDEAQLAELFPQLEDRTQEAERLAEAYGLEVCGKAEE